MKQKIGVSPLDGELVEYYESDEIEFTRYKCPNCGRFSDEMKLLDIRYEPNAKELREHPNVAGELLECKCGKVLRWPQMQKVIEVMERNGKV